MVCFKTLIQPPVFYRHVWASNGLKVLFFWPKLNVFLPKLNVFLPKLNVFLDITLWILRSKHTTYYVFHFNQIGVCDSIFGPYSPPLQLSQFTLNILMLSEKLSSSSAASHISCFSNKYSIISYIASYEMVACTGLYIVFIAAGNAGWA